MNKNNLILKVDSYKFSHPFLFPKGMTSAFNYLEARGGKYDETVFFGLQYILKKHFANPITEQDVVEAKDFCQKHGVPFAEDKWLYIARDLKGKLPIRIRAVKEGSIVKNHNALMTIESTDDNCYWLPGHLETILMQIWYPITVASQSYQARKTIMKYLELSSDDPNSEIDFKHHSFGYRGVSSVESAEIGGMAELLFSKGTDTIAGILAAMEYYNSDVCGFSIPASEHSTMTSYGREHEIDAYKNMLNQFGKPGGIFACVSDSYDIFNSLENLWGGEFREQVLNSGATVVLRPDSGSPAEVVSKCLQILDKKFGSTLNSKGYKVLNVVRLIQGDGIDLEMIDTLYKAITDLGFSATNLAVGQGGGSLQKVNRDTYKMAVKCSSVIVNGEERDVFKDPITDPGKRSKPGRLDLAFVDTGSEMGGYETVPLFDDEIGHKRSVMATVFENGEIKKNYTFEQVRQKAQSDSKKEVNK